MVVSLVEEVRRAFELKIARLETTIATLAGRLETLTVVVEQQKRERGPRGTAGAKGERGEAGPPAAKIAAWSTSESDFTVVPIYVGGELGPPLKLEPLLRSLARALAADEAAR